MGERNRSQKYSTTSQTKRKRTAAEEEEEDIRMDRHKRKHSWSSRYYCLLTLLLAFQ